MASSAPKRFVPLKQGAHQLPAETPKLRGVVFDMDGTLWYVLFFLNRFVHGCWSDSESPGRHLAYPRPQPK
ncbi:HAD superfamily hydrolase [Ilyonectria robusta]